VQLLNCLWLLVIGFEEAKIGVAARPLPFLGEVYEKRHPYCACVVFRIGPCRRIQRQWNIARLFERSGCESAKSD
jgi:hypothetical protein